MGTTFVQLVVEPYLDPQQTIGEAEEMVNGASVSGYIVTQIIRAIRDLGKEPGPILASARLDESTLAEADTRVPLHIAWEFAKRANALCDTPQLGLEIASQVGEGYPMLRYSLRNAGTLGEAFSRWGRFYGLISDHGVQSLIPGNASGVMRCERLVDTSTPILVEDWMVGQWLTLGRLLVGVDWAPLEVRLEHSSADNSGAYEEWFGAPVCFDGRFSELAIPNDTMDLPIIGSDSSLSAVLDRHIENVLARRSGSTSFTVRTRAAMAQQMDGGDPSAASIARKLNVSERTLLRRLREEGTTPTEVLQELRLELAENYLADPEISLTEISYLLGYSEVSAFHRAFKRWTGNTPAEFRDNH